MTASAIISSTTRYWKTGEVSKSSHQDHGIQENVT